MIFRFTDGTLFCVITWRCARNSQSSAATSSEASHCRGREGASPAPTHTISKHLPHSPKPEPAGAACWRHYRTFNWASVKASKGKEKRGKKRKAHCTGLCRGTQTSRHPKRAAPSPADRARAGRAKHLLRKRARTQPPAPGRCLLGALALRHDLEHGQSLGCAAGTTTVSPLPMFRAILYCRLCFFG